MRQEQIFEWNKLIAMFMGLPSPPVNEIGYYAPCELEYHTSWDCLMPVVEKIEGMDCHVVIGTNKIELQADGFCGSSRVGYGYSKIQCLFEVITEFIQWYNKQLQK